MSEKLNLFKDILPSLMKNKDNYLFTDPDRAKDHLPYLVNKALSYHKDTILYANEMNGYPRIDEKLHYDYLYYSIQRKSRPFVPWDKMQKSDEIDAVKSYFKYSTTKAIEALRVLTKDQVAFIVKKTTIGGVSKK